MLQLISGGSVQLVMLVITVFTFGIKVFAVADCALRPTGAFLATGKLTKLKWLAIVGVALVLNLVIFSPISFLNIIGDVAALVYLVDVRPALRALGDGGAIRRSKPRGGPNRPTGW